ncbi:VaFE repeat-containing surface-anchored protein [Corynebacterium hesseae]
MTSKDEPSESTTPEQPGDETCESTTPSKPGEETTPNNPGESTTPGKPGESTTPGKPGESTTPNDPCESTTPDKPGEEPSESTTPKTTEKTTEPSESTTPNKPGDETCESTTPSKPGEETTPNNPGESTTPGKPGESTTPGKPGESTTPNDPCESTTPDKPGEEPSESTTPREPGDESGKPKISTNADFANGATEVVAGAQVNDTVTYENLVPGKEYTLFAELISKEDGKTVLGEGEKTFTPESANGEVVVEIIVDESVTKPVEAAVAFEELTSVEVNDKGEETPGTDPENPNHIAEHKDINDKNQTVPKSGDDESGKPKISTNADFANGATEVVAGAQVNDRVTYENLVPGKEYTLFAELISKEDGKTVLGKGEKTFTPESANGEVVVEIIVDESVKEPVEAAVAFEELTSVEVNDKGEETPDTDPENPNHIAEHKDINDKNQTVPKSGDDESGKPKISTNADFANGATEVVAGAQVNDRVTYENLVPGKEYTLFAELISKEDGKTVLGKGEKTFTPESANGEVVVTITVDESVTEPVEAAVAFEELTSVEVNDKGEETPDTDPENPNHIAEHKDINDKNQTVPKSGDDESGKPKISTNADFANGATQVVAGAQVNDRVTYENLVPGKEYTLFAELISKEDGKTVLGKGSKTFTPESANGEVVVEIIVDESVTKPVEAAVAFEELTSVEVNDKGEETPDTDPENPNHIAEHKDINDKNQTVTSDSDKPSHTPDKGDGKDNDGDKGSSKKDLPWWLLLIPGLGLIKIITDGGHNGGNGGHDGGNGGHNHGESHDNTGRDDREVTVLDATPPEDAANQPQDFGQPMPSNTHRVEIKHVPSGATELDPGMQDFIK